MEINIAAIAAQIIDRLPLEKLLIKPPDRRKELTELHDIISGSHATPVEKPRDATLQATAVSRVEMPTTGETLAELKRRLGKELYRIEMDLQGGGRIAGKPCDCLDNKHTLGLESTAEELMSYESNPVYGEVISWLKSHDVDFRPEEIVKHEKAYYQAMSPEVRGFRKRVMGTEDRKALQEEYHDVEIERHTGE